MSETNTPASTSTSVTATGNDSQRINGCTFFKITKEEYMQDGIVREPATALVNFAKECKEKKLRAFSIYHSLKEVLMKYGLVSEGTELKSYRTLVMTSLEFMRNEYISTILHTALHIAKDSTGKNFSMKPEYEIIGKESCERVDYAIKESDSLICVTEDKVQQKLTKGFTQNIMQLESLYETNKRKRKRDDKYFDYLYGIITSAKDWHFLLYSPGEILQASKAPFSIKFTEEALVENSEKYKILRT
ncbi:hypothetical protein C1645_833088 [Glomus cerebriforme]|uniref:Uncharacterized protein n=1 Tax=Glomus cerebriforme TaxID=658196 RepID=A0A397SC96_9GLOM|nr:hypothetical protein C1645_833088 [Glomus cerebriforme]